MNTANVVPNETYLMNWQDFACKIAYEVGIPHEKTSRTDSFFMWNGRCLLIPEKENFTTLHEIAHWKYASPDRRDLPDFGLLTIRSRKYFGKSRDKYISFYTYTYSFSKKSFMRSANPKLFNSTTEEELAYNQQKKWQNEWKTTINVTEN